MQQSSSNRYLSGNLAPVAEEVTVFDLPVTGTLPVELDGRYVRNGPNPIGDVDPATYHWFTGAGMVHGIRLRDGRAEWYRNRWVRDANVAAQLGEAAPPTDWPAGHMSFAANTNVIQHAGRTLAIVEAGAPPVELGYELDTVRVTSFDGTLPQAFSAHPKRDPRTGELHTMTYWWGWGNQVQYVVVGVDGRVRRTVDIPLPGGPMIHDTSITEHYVMVFDLPCIFDLDAAMSGARLPYVWDAEYEARIGLLPRDGGAEDIRWCSIDPCYVFHPMNSYERPDGTVVLDAARHPKMFDANRLGPDEGPPRLTRWVLDPRTGTATEETIDDRPQEFPRIDESRIGFEHRYGYCAGIDDDFREMPLIKVDLETRRTEVRADSPRYAYGEPVFIGRSDDAHRAEDDGWVMALRHDTQTDRSDLAVFDAQAITDDPVAVVHLPVRVPAGFHGNWMPTGA